MIGILSAFATLLVSFAVAGLWWWFGFTLAILVVLGVAELVSVKKTGMTLSQQYTQLVRKRPVVGYILHAVLGAFFGALLYHLATGW